MSAFARLPGTLRRLSLSKPSALRRRLTAVATPSLSPYIRLSPSVKRALENKQPVVALESTIISHGMPYPQNVETAQQVEKIVEANGSTPATIALIDGKIHVGLCESELDHLGKAGNSAVKTSRRDMAMVLSQRLLGATTVSGTMIAAHMAGIPIFATGGIGGVHRGAESTMDISADLTELGRTPVAVVCAGAKSILDLPKTLEYLETQGVPVITFGKEKEFPAFFSARSGLMAPWNLETPEKVAALVKTSLDIGLGSGMVVAAPIPEQHADSSSVFENAISVAVSEAETKGIKGKESTPFLLKRIVELTGGASLTANIALVKNNAMVASQIAKSLSSMNKSASRPFATGHLQRRGHSTQRRVVSRAKFSGTHSEHPLLVVGGAAIDVTAQIDSAADGAKHSLATSYPGTVHTSVGGVGQNVARAAHFLGADTVLVAAIGHDPYGSSIKTALDDIGMDTRFLQYPGECARTAVYNALHAHNGDLIAAVADMDINGMVSAQQVQEVFLKLAPRVVGIDGNLSILAISTTIMAAGQAGSCVLFEPTSVPKCISVLNALSFIKRSEAIVDVGHLVHVITPNQIELRRMAEVALELGLVETMPLAETVEEMAHSHYTIEASIIRDALTLFPLFPVQIIKLGEKGAAIVSPSPKTPTLPLVRSIRPLKPSLVINSNGAGDSMVGAILASLLDRKVRVTADGYVDISPWEFDTIVSRAQKASILSLESSLAISEKLEPGLLQED
ncbi:hypothetical protein H4R99_004467 [Coemansia sp. RSA 1722]|nr:hypothetical protein LPJ57_004196 [Coemansia sp. RSA 486]KAJ2234083.1 hypothetical protein IWW45_003687 [Coemansia sp. RSA 485]KAJ2597540.1 hypothetical protein H4R99_004467 [Coemansia sp. RSA 1722]